jgi:predicted O-linked N-acetylglucosamine transferase (SPINDLY family)
MREILQLIEEMQVHHEQTARKASKHRKQMVRRLDDMQAAIGKSQESLRLTQEALKAVQAGLTLNQEAMAGLDRSVGGLRADVDQLEAADMTGQEHLGRLARAMNAFVDGTELRLSAIEARVERLEQKSA